MKTRSSIFFQVTVAALLIASSQDARPAGTGSFSLRSGVPAAWLVGGIHDGRAGNEIYGADVDKYLRPNPGQAYLGTQMMAGSIEAWHDSPVSADGRCEIFRAAPHSYGWSRGTGYACLYLKAERESNVLLHLQQSGIQTTGWIDDTPLRFEDDRTPPTEIPRRDLEKPAQLEGLTTEGLIMTALPENAEGARVATLSLAPGWHRLLVKMIMQNAKGEPFFFAARFTDAEGNPAEGLAVQTFDPSADLKLNAVASRFRPLVFVEAPANLPRPGDPLKVMVDMDWHPVREEKEPPITFLPFDAILRVRITNYQGREIAARESKGTFPCRVSLDFGSTPETGYYIIHTSLHAPDGRLIHSFHSDGFTVAPGTVAQRERLEKKKLWTNNYYIFSDNKEGGGFRGPGEDFQWLLRSGVFKNFGADAELNDQVVATFKQAHDLGLVLFADFSRDEPGNDSPEEARAMADAMAPFTRYFKSTNEIDIQHGKQVFDTVRDPAHWVRRTKWEYEAVRRARADGIFVGGSLVRPGDMRPAQRSGIPGPGEWFVQCLKLGLDKYLDAWDVHAYPQNPPRFGGGFGNGSVEDERGVNAAYRAVGGENKLPFWLGEVGAKAAHCQTGRRGQAELAAKMIAWVNSRSDYLGIAFCIGYEYDWARGRLWDYSMGHKPGEAAMITAGALIDGLPYQPVETGDPNIQAARFGPTFMVWRTDDKTTEYSWPVGEAAAPVIVDVVGTMRDLKVVGGGVRFPISASPAYILPQADYQQLTRSQ